jgi:hypothetical protein
MSWPFRALSEVAAHGKAKVGSNCFPPLLSGALARFAQRAALLFVVQPKLAKHWFFASELKEITMRKLLIGSAAALAAAVTATPAAAQYYGYGYSPYSYGYGYSPYSYGYSYPSYSYSYPSYSYGYSYPSYGYGYSNYGYSYPSYHYRSHHSCRLRQHHHNGVYWYTRDC